MLDLVVMEEKKVFLTAPYRMTPKVIRRIRKDQKMCNNCRIIRKAFIRQLRKNISNFVT